MSGPGRASVLTPSVATGEGSSVDTGTGVTNEIIVIVEGRVHISITGNRTQLQLQFKSEIQNLNMKYKI